MIRRMVGATFIQFERLGKPEQRVKVIPVVKQLHAIGNIQPDQSFVVFRGAGLRPLCLLVGLKCALIGRFGCHALPKEQPRGETQPDDQRGGHGTGGVVQMTRRCETAYPHASPKAP